VATMGSSSGSALLEVMIALSLLAIVLVSLGETASSLLSRAARLDWAPSQRENGPAADAWTWGPRPGVIQWRLGPGLEIRLQGSGTQGAERIGVWVDGWLRSEVPASGRVVTIGDPGDWSGRTGSEVVVRARRLDGPWGSPLRTVVPSLFESNDTSSDQTIATAALSVHLPTAGQTTLDVGLGTAAARVTAFATPTSVIVGALGVASIRGNGDEQQVFMMDGTDVDVYQ
jgi:hypothetical protein